MTSPLPRPRILVVDDDALFARALKRLLLGLDVTLAANAVDALDLLGRDAAFDLILCDIMMPGGSGLAFLEQLWQRAPAMVPLVVFMTGGATSVVSQRALRDVTNAKLHKPFEREDVLTLLAQRAGRARAAAGGTGE